MKKINFKFQNQFNSILLFLILFILEIPLFPLSTKSNIKELQFPFKKVTITGATGFVGAQLQRAILQNFPHVKQLNLLHRNTQKKHRLIDSNKTNLIQGNLLDMQTLDKITNDTELVYHLGGYAGIGERPDEHAIAIINTLSTLILSKICKVKNKKMIFASTIKVYTFRKNKSFPAKENENLENRNDVRNWISEAKILFNDLAEQIMDSKINFIEATEQTKSYFQNKSFPKDLHPYDLFKYLGERFVLENEGIVLRFANVFGPGDESERVVPKFLPWMMSGDSSEKLNYIPGRYNPYAFIEDVIKAYIKTATYSLTSPDINNRIFNISTFDLISEKEFFLMMKEVTDFKGIIAGYTKKEMQKKGLRNLGAEKINFSKSEKILGMEIIREKSNPFFIEALKKGLILTKSWLEKDNIARWNNVFSFSKLDKQSA